jgi:hypothetical protein
MNLVEHINTVSQQEFGGLEPSTASSVGVRGPVLATPVIIAAAAVGLGIGVGVGLAQAGRFTPNPNT